MIQTATLIIAIIGLVLSVYAAFFKKPNTTLNNKRILTIDSDEMNVTTKIMGDKRFLIDENKEVLDKKRIII